VKLRPLASLIVPMLFTGHREVMQAMRAFALHAAS
jgi:hypothetical protein